MSLPAVAYLVGMGLLFVGERLIGGGTPAHWLIDGLGGVALVAALVVQIRHSRSAEDPGRRRGRRLTAILSGVGIASLALYFLGSEAVAGALGLAETGSERWTTVLQVLWPVVWLVGTAPMLVVDHALTNSPVVAPHGRITQALQQGLAAALGIALLFPVNYLADRHDARWDLAYFETAEPGTATRKIVEGAERPVHVYTFLPPASEVVEEVRGYFESLIGPNLTYRRVDQTTHPRLARELRVRRNGYVVLTTRPPESLEGGDSTKSSSEKTEDSDGSETQKTGETQRLRIGIKLERAKDELENMDAEVQQRLLAIAQGKRVAYMTTGHGEISDSGSRKARRARRFEDILESLNFRVEPLGMNEGLAEGVPDDADLVVILGPTESFLDEEVAALRRYRNGGGSLLVALEPDFTKSRLGTLESDDPLRGFLSDMGVGLGEGVLTATEDIVPTSNSLADRVNIHTNGFENHPSTSTLARASKRIVLITPAAGWWSLDDTGTGQDNGKSDIETTVTTRSRTSVWADKDGDLQFDPEDGESRKAWPLAVAVTGPIDTDNADAASKQADGPIERDEWRALLVSDATAFTDAVARNKGNHQFIYDGVNWAVHAEAISGEVSSKEDVRIRHTREGQALWFWGPVAGFPLLVLAVGGFRVWRRRRGGEA